MNRGCFKLIVWLCRVGYCHTPKSTDRCATTAKLVFCSINKLLIISPTAVHTFIPIQELWSADLTRLDTWCMPSNALSVQTLTVRLLLLSINIGSVKYSAIIKKCSLSTISVFTICCCCIEQTYLLISHIPETRTGDHLSFKTISTCRWVSACRWVHVCQFEVAASIRQCAPIDVSFGWKSLTSENICMGSKLAQEVDDIIANKKKNNELDGSLFRLNSM